MVFEKIKKFFEYEKKIRGVKFYFLINKILKKDEQEKFEIKLKSSAILTEFYSGITVSFSPNYVKRNWTYIKIYCPNSQFVIRESGSQSFYENLFDNYCEYVTNLFKKNNLESEVFDFRILFRIYPEEDTNEYLPLCNLGRISSKIIGKEMTEKIPSNKDEMIRYLKSLYVFSYLASTSTSGSC